MSQGDADNRPYYVLLTGSKNNAGDYLIKFRAKKLLASLRPDRKVIDMDAWQPFDDKTLEIINAAQALVLMGGPALQKNMYPAIYPMRENLNDITVPILVMGIGWKSLDGAWNRSRNYPLLDSTVKLLDKVEVSGYRSSVRDYHTLNVLQSRGYKSFVMTGCPALNDLQHLRAPLLEKGKINKVAFSLGVSFLESKEMLKQMKASIVGFRSMFQECDFEVIFHHSLDDGFVNTHNATSRHLKGHRVFAAWLEENDVKYKDISGSAENLIDCYSAVDLHIGYRVHAHIFMTSIGKRSMLIAEDGRGKALKGVCDGLIIDGVDGVPSSIVHRILRKLGLFSGYKVSDTLPGEALAQLEYEIENEYPRMRKSQILLQDNYQTMNAFIAQLP